MFKRQFITFFLILLPVFGSDIANAHKAILFAYVHDNKIYCESKFAGGNRIRQGEISVYDQAGKFLLSGRTNENGHFNFRIPQLSDLKIVLKSGHGHRAEWIVKKHEMKPDRSSHESDKIDDSTDNISNGISGDTKPPANCGNCVSAEDIRNMINQSIDQELKSIKRMLAEAQNPMPSIQNIIGGIGYIIGLIGIGAYFNNRRKKN